MKRILFSLAAGVIALGLQAQATPASGVKGTPHDLSLTTIQTSTFNATGTAAADYQSCIYCHAPHNNNNAVQDGKGGNLVPLWNRAVTTTTFKMYGSQNVSAATQVVGVIDAQPTGVSLACLSCHDGSLALGAVANVTSMATYGAYANTGYTTTGSANWTTGATPTTDGTIMADSRIGYGGDLSNDHPISITYDAVNDLGLNPAAAINNGTTKSGFNSPSGRITLVGNVLPLFDGKVQCASCHDVHNYAFSPKTGQGGAPYLRVDNRQQTNPSALCTTCHKK